MEDDTFDPSFFDRAGRFLRWITRIWFRARVHGLERLPPGPCLVVGNHSALANAEIACMLGGWQQAFGRSRRVTGLMHDLFIRIPGVGHFYRRIGAVPARREAALEAFAAGHDVLVFPGGDVDACRPFYQPRGVHFGQRRGYIRLALEAGVPIVPVATIGSHYSWLFAPGGQVLARLFGLKRLFRLECLPLPLGWLAAALMAVLGAAGVVSWGWVALVALLAAIPTPARVTSEFLPALDVAKLTEGLEGDARVEKAHGIVYGALQNAVTNMRHRR